MRVSRWPPTRGPSFGLIRLEKQLPNEIQQRDEPKGEISGQNRCRQRSHERTSEMEPIGIMRVIMIDD